MEEHDKRLYNQHDGEYTERQYADFTNWLYICDQQQFYNLRSGKYLNETGFVSLYQPFFPEYNIPKRFRKGEDFKYDLNGDSGKSHIIPIVESSCFRPGTSTLTKDNMVNLWSPPIEGKQGDITPFLEHMVRLFPDDEDLDYVLDYLYYTIAHPEKKIQFALLVIGKQGTGKSVIFDAMLRRILGTKMVAKVEMDELESNFDRWKRGKKVAIFSEFSTRFKSSLYRKVKEVITDTTLSCTTKFNDTVEMENYLNIIAFSNDSAPIKLEQGDRRWMIIESPAVDFEDKDERSSYFDRLWRLVNDHPERIAHFFLEEYQPVRLDIHGVAPMTKKKQEIVEASVGSLDRALEAFMDDCVRDRYTVFSQDDFISFVMFNPNYQDCIPFAKSPNTRMEVFDKYGVHSLGRQTNSNKYTTKNLYGLPHEDFTGVTKAMAAKRYDDERSSPLNRKRNNIVEMRKKVIGNG